MFKMTPRRRADNAGFFQRQQWRKSHRRAGAGHQWQFLWCDGARWKSQYKRRLWLWHAVQDDSRRIVDDAGLVQPRQWLQSVSRLGTRQRWEFLRHNGQVVEQVAAARCLKSPRRVLATLRLVQRSHGKSPQAPLVQGSKRPALRRNQFGGSNGRGTVFQVTPTGVLTTLVSF